MALPVVHPVEEPCEWDSAELATGVRAVMPNAAGAILVGSAVSRTHSISDLDVIAFSREIPLGTDRVLSFAYRTKPVHVVAYHPDYFDLIWHDETLYLLYYREIRKLRDGRVLFDTEGLITPLLAALAVKPPPLDQLRAVIDWLLANPNPNSRTDFLLAVERLAFCWLHISREYRYAKPKWLLEDCRRVRSSSLASLIEAVSQELLDLKCPLLLASRLKYSGRDFLSANAGSGLHFANNLADASVLLSGGRPLDAVWPLRMASAMLVAARAEELQLVYGGIGDLDRFSRAIAEQDAELSAIVNDLFLLNHDVGAGLQSLYISALRAFEEEWSECCRPRAELVQSSSGFSLAHSHSASATLAPPGFVSGQGLWLTSSSGDRYLDAVSGTFNLPFGYNDPYITRAVSSQLSRLSHLSSTFADESATRLVKRLLCHAGGKVETGWLRDCTGSTAIECAVKIAQKYTGGSDVVTLYYSHHGQTLFTSAISNDSSRRRPFPAAASSGVVRAPAPYCHRCFYQQRHPDCGLLCADRIAEIVDHTSQGPVAALIVEPILGNGGNIPLPAGYGEKLREYCSRNGILLIADEVQTGLGRTGEVLASPNSGLDPDIIVLAKGLGGIGLPIGAVLARAEHMTLLKTEHSFTSGGNLLAIAAANATLDLLEQPGFMEEVRRKGTLLGDLLHDIARRHRCVGEIRGRGFMWGVELDRADGGPAVELANEAVELAYRRERLILRTSRYGRGNVLKIRPALIATDAELRELVERLDRVLVELEA